MTRAVDSALNLAAIQILRYAVNKGARDKNRQAAAWAITHYERMRRRVLIDQISLKQIDDAIDALQPLDLPDEQTPTFTGVQRERQAKRGWMGWLPW